MPSPSPVELLVVLSVGWIFWSYVLQPLLIKSPLDNLPGPPSESFWTGNLMRFWDRYSWEFHLDVARNHGPVVNIKGFLNKPALYVYDPKALHSIIIKDQYIYEETPMFFKINQMQFGPGLLSAVGDDHRKQRRMLNPVFSAAHMRSMTPIFHDVVERLHTALATRVAEGPRELDMLDWMGRTALELIGQGGLGYSFDPLVEDQCNDYATAIKGLLPALFSLGVLQYAIPYVTTLGTPAFRRRLLQITPSRRVHKLAQIIDTIHCQSVEIYNAKKAALEKGDKAIERQIGAGKDLMSILIRANTEAKTEEDRLTEDQLIAQVSTFTFGATDTTSNTLATILHLIAQRPNVQDRLRAEVLQSRKQSSEHLSYDELMQLPYLDAICRETLRLHAPVDILERQPRQDMILPLSRPIRGVNGEMISEIPVPKGTPIFLGIVGSNLSEALWGEDALEWMPERWLSPLPQTVTDARVPGVYSNIMTFIGGNRACIGFKFSELEMKVVLSTLISHFTFELTDKPIYWNMAAVRYPTVGKESTRAEMPLKVGLVKTGA